MAAKCLTILIEENRWHIASTNSELSPIAHTIDITDIDLDKTVEQLCQYLSEQEIHETNIVLAVDSSQAFCDQISLQELPKKYRHQAMMYRLEEVLPVAAEGLVCDFIEIGGKATALAAEITILQPIIDALEQKGYLVEHICPSAMLAIQHYLDSKSAVNADLYLWQHDNRIEVILLEDGKLADWSVVSATPEDVKVSLSLLAIQRGQQVSVVCGNIGSPILAAIEQVDGLQFAAEHTQPFIETASLGGQRVGAGQTSPWADLRRDQLAASDPYRQIRKPLNFAFASVLIFLLVTCSLFIWQAKQYNTMADQYTRKQKQIFTEALPNQRVAAGAILSRLNSELNGMNRLRGQATDLPTLPSALQRMRHMILLLPENQSFDIDRIAIKEKTISISGKAKSLTLANTIASGLNNPDATKNITGFKTELPKTELLGDGSVTFTINGTPNDSSQPGGISK